jgi:hypothetical protein
MIMIMAMGRVPRGSKDSASSRRLESGGIFYQ